MMNQPDIGWCPCCNRAVVELPQGYCSECFNHTMTVMSAYDHEEQLSAMTQAKEKAEAESADNKRKMLEAMRSEGGWIWQGDGGDNLQSLACPVVIMPDQLTKLLEEAKRQAVPEGWKLVPVELPASIRCVMIDQAHNISKGMVLLYASMWDDLLSASPKPEGVDK